MNTLTEYLVKLQLIYDAYHASGGFDNGSYLKQHNKEDDDDYILRQSHALYDNMLKPACARYAGYLSRNPAIYDTDDPLIAEIMNDCDGSGIGIQGWMIESAKEFKPYGIGIGLVSMPNMDIPVNLQDQIDEKAYPRFSRITPHVITEYKINDYGLFEKLEIQRNEYVGDTIQTITRYWDTETWIVKSGTHVLAQGEISGGLCPAVPFAEDQFPHLGEFSQVANIAKRLYNLESGEDEIIEDQAFSVLTYQIPQEMAGNMLFSNSSIKEAIGTKSVVKYYGDNAPAYASPDAEQITSIETKIERLIGRIKEITHSIEKDSDVPESGVARKIRFQDLNSSLSDYAASMESFSKRMLDVACSLLGKSLDIYSVNWPRQFDISDVDQEFLTLEQMQATGFPQAAISEQKKKIVAQTFPGSDEDDLQDIYDQIDQETQGGV